MNPLRKEVEAAIHATTCYTKDELSEMDVDELEFIAEVLSHTDANLDGEELQTAINNLTE